MDGGGGTRKDGCGGGADHIASVAGPTEGGLVGGSLRQPTKIGIKQIHY